MVSLSSIKKSTLRKGAVVVLIAVLAFFASKGDFDNLFTSNVVTAWDDGVVEVTTVLQGFQYQPDTITVKEGSTVRLTIDNRDNVNHGLHLPQFGIVQGMAPLKITTVEFTAIDTPTNGQAIPTCSKEHGETLTINVV